MQPANIFLLLPYVYSCTSSGFPEAPFGLMNIFGNSHWMERLNLSTIPVDSDSEPVDLNRFMTWLFKLFRSLTDWQTTLLVERWRHISTLKGRSWFSWITIPDSWSPSPSCRRPWGVNLNYPSFLIVSYVKTSDIVIGLITDSVCEGARYWRTQIQMRLSHLFERPRKIVGCRDQSNMAARGS